MITRVGKFPNSSVKKGFITHQMQETDGAFLRIVYANATHTYVLVKIDDALITKAQTWVANNSGEVLTVANAKTEIQNDITAAGDVSVTCSLGYQHTVTAATRWSEVLNAVTNF